MDSDSSPRSAYDVAAQLQHRRTASGQINMRKIDGWQTLANQVAAGDRIQLGSMLSPVQLDQRKPMILSSIPMWTPDLVKPITSANSKIV